MVIFFLVFFVLFFLFFGGAKLALKSPKPALKWANWHLSVQTGTKIIKKIKAGTKAPKPVAAAGGRPLRSHHRKDRNLLKNQGNMPWVDLACADCPGFVLQVLLVPCIPALSKSLRTLHLKLCSVRRSPDVHRMFVLKRVKTGVPPPPVYA